MNYFDLHCDTLGECYSRQKSLYDNGLHVDLFKTKAFHTYIQCMAVWIPDSYSGEEAYSYFLERYALLKDAPLCLTGNDLKRVNDSGGIGLIPTVEGGRVLGGSLSKIDDLAHLGVRMLTLTWNGDSEFGGGIGGSGAGLTPFGKQAIRKLEQNRIIVDISHAGLQLFDDVCCHSTMPFIASHSNAKPICSHRRNLSDAQAKEIIRRGGLIGLNFYVDFLENDPNNARVESIVRHAEHFLALGAENALSMGSDFDGAEIPGDMEGIASVEKIWEAMAAHNYPEALLKKIFYENAYCFMEKNMGL